MLIFNRMPSQLIYPRKCQRCMSLVTNCASRRMLSTPVQFIMLIYINVIISIIMKTLNWTSKDKTKCYVFIKVVGGWFKRKTKHKTIIVS